MQRLEHLLVLGLTLFLAALFASAEETCDSLKHLVELDPKPFAMVEGVGKGKTPAGQGVFVREDGMMVTAGHLCWNGAEQEYVQRFHAILRTRAGEAPAGATHHHKAEFLDREGAVFHEHRYPAELVRQEGSRFVAGKDVCLVQVEQGGPFPKVGFYSNDEPEVELGDVLYLCHYFLLSEKAEPTFLVNPIEVVGVADTTSGTQYLASGFYRWGSSGAAILKDGRLLGVQSGAYTVNAKDIVALSPYPSLAILETRPLTRTSICCDRRREA